MIDRICRVCGKKFKQSKYETKRKGIAKYCDSTCTGISQRRQVICKCHECNKKFSIKKSLLRRTRGKFCSVKCMNKNRENKITCTCLRCKKKFLRIPSLTFRENSSDSHCFCGTECYLKYRGRTSIEKIIMKSLRSLHFNFKEQKPLSFIGGRTFVDFFIKPNICIYVDGDYWHSFPSAIRRDKRNNTKLKKNGYIVIRISEKTINKGKNYYMPILKEIKKLQKNKIIT